METILQNEQKLQFSALLEQAERVVVTCHIRPDGDAVGSVTAAVQLLSRLGKKAVGVIPNAFPDFLKWLPGATDLVHFDKSPEQARTLLQEADFIFCMDYNAPSRVGEAMAEALRQSHAHRVMIDHHLDPQEGCELTISVPHMCSTCEVLLHVMEQMGWTDEMTKDEAVSLYTGMMTDTGAFTYASNRPDVYECIALLLHKGIDKDRIYRNVFWTSSLGRLQLQGYLLYVKLQVMKQQHAALITLTNEEYKRFSVKNGDTEGLVNIPLQMEGIRLSVFLREDTEVKGKIRVSTRSVDDFPCNEMAAEFFNGGGHKNAAGGSLMCTMDEAVEMVLQAIKKYEYLLKD